MVSDNTDSRWQAKHEEKEPGVVISGFWFDETSPELIVSSTKAM